MSDKNKKTSFLTSVKSMFKRVFAPSGQKTGLSALEEEAIQTPTKVIMKNFFSNKLAIIGMVGFISIFSFSFIGSAMNPVNYVDNELVLKNIQPGTNYLDFPKDLQEAGVEKIVSGVSYSLAIDKNGKIHAWGTNQNDVLEIPEDVKKAKLADIASGDRHAIALGTNGKLYAWGYSNFQQGEIPQEIAGALMLSTPTKVFAGELYSGVLTDKNEIYIWGATEASSLAIIPGEYQGRIVDVATAAYNIILTLDDGTVATIGTRGADVNEIPTYLTDGSTKVEKVAMSLRSAIALDNTGKIHVWGSTDKGLKNVPEINEKIVDIGADKNAMFALGESGIIYHWGSDAFNEQQVPVIEGSDKIVDIDAAFFQNYAITESGKIEAWGNKGFLLGSDEQGRDMLTRLMHGGKVTLVVGVIAVIIATVLGLLVGMTAGFIGGRVDNFLMRLAEIVTSVPFMPLVITLSAFISNDVSTDTKMFIIMAILGLLSWPGLARLVRAQILIEREKDFVLAARALGIKEYSIVLKHIMPNVLNISIVNMTLMYASTMLTEAGLSFLGFGVAPPQPSWGNMLNGAQSSSVIEFYWWRWILPAVAVMLAALSVNLIGDALRDALDPKANEK